MVRLTRDDLRVIGSLVYSVLRSEQTEALASSVIHTAKAHRLCDLADFGTLLFCVQHRLAYVPKPYWSPQY
jgi:hypothetical protein